ncbi:MAG: VPGUxxT family thioredoxin-like (seleno)protein, type 2 [Bacteroidota bacterium]
MKSLLWFSVAMLLALLGLTYMSFSFASARFQSDGQVELGEVDWLRDYDEALAQSKTSGKPLFILFQEVPGCHNCQKFGKEVLSHRLIVDAIENEFVPLAIFNNKGGQDAAVLKHFREPSWNNPVVRIFDQKERELTARMGNFHPQEVINGMAEALETAGKPIPVYLDLLAQQTNARFGLTETAVFSMYCFWSGELKLGQLEGVIETAPGFMNGREVVQLTYDQGKTNYDQLVQSAKQVGAIDGAFYVNKSQESMAKNHFSGSSTKPTKEFVLDGAPKYYLSKTKLKYLPMLPLQRIEVNRAIYERRGYQQYLSPGQLARLDQIEQSSKRLSDVSHSSDFMADMKALDQQLNP